EFLFNGAVQYNEPGVFVSFEEKEEDLVRNVHSLGFNLDELEKQKKLHIEYVHVEQSEMEETGVYDLDGLFIRLGYAIDSVGAKRIVLDTLESLFSGFKNESILRAEIRKLFRWLREKEVTAVITAEKGDKTITRFGLEEYISDCVILLDNRMVEQVATRRLRIVKYRGSTHGTNEYPFLIGDGGITVVPVTSINLDYKVSPERISSGIPELDKMLGGEGFYKGSSILVSGRGGTGKTSIAAHFAEAACRRGEKCLFICFEESPDQLIRNMRTIGIDLQKWKNKDLLRFHAIRPTFYGLEKHLLTIQHIAGEFKPLTIVIDPISDLLYVGTKFEVKLLLLRLLDFVKRNMMTSLYTNLIGENRNDIEQITGFSSITDTWINIQQVPIAIISSALFQL
ncbi:MAG: circadian clock protein KaiC, partial [Calditrichia bacterium]